MRLSAIALIVASLLSLSACSRLGLGSASMTFQTVYPSSHQSEVTVHYSLPAPPKGKVYVLWIVNPYQRQTVEAGSVPPGREQTAHATVDFAATGAIVSIEDGVHPASMGGDWALHAGQVTPATPTPDPLRITPTAAVTPGATPTP